MPLGLPPGMKYEKRCICERATAFCSTVTAWWSPQSDPRDAGLPAAAGLDAHPTKAQSGAVLARNARANSPAGWGAEEDDVTMVLSAAAARPSPRARTILARFGLPSEPGNERRAMEQIGEIVALWDCPQARRSGSRRPWPKRR